MSHTLVTELSLSNPPQSRQLHNQKIDPLCGGVTVEMRDAQSAAFDAWDRQLIRSYEAMQNLVDGSQRHALQTEKRMAGL